LQAKIKQYWFTGANVEMYTNRAQNITKLKKIQKKQKSQNLTFILKNEFLGSSGLFCFFNFVCMHYNIIKNISKHISLFLSFAKSHHISVVQVNGILFSAQYWKIERTQAQWPCGDAWPLRLQEEL
jgi:hypothetical protein